MKEIGLNFKLSSADKNIARLDIFLNDINITKHDNAFFIPATINSINCELNKLANDDFFFDVATKIKGDSLEEKFDYLYTYEGSEINTDLMDVLDWDSPLDRSYSFIIPVEKKLYLVTDTYEESGKQVYLSFPVELADYLKQISELRDELLKRLESSS